MADGLIHRAAWPTASVMRDIKLPIKSPKGAVASTTYNRLNTSQTTALYASHLSHYACNPLAARTIFDVVRPGGAVLASLTQSCILSSGL